MVSSSKWGTLPGCIEAKNWNWLNCECIIHVLLFYLILWLAINIQCRTTFKCKKNLKRMSSSCPSSFKQNQISVDIWRNLIGWFNWCIKRPHTGSLPGKGWVLINGWFTWLLDMDDDFIGIYINIFCRCTVWKNNHIFVWILKLLWINLRSTLTTWSIISNNVCCCGHIFS